MQDRELYRQLMGLREPWAVTEVRVDLMGEKLMFGLSGLRNNRGRAPNARRLVGYTIIGKSGNGGI